MENKIRLVTKWFSDSGLKVNEPKSDVCIFYKKDTHPITIDLNGSTITSSNTTNVLGVIFDSKLQWSNQVANSIRKADSALHAIKLIRGFFDGRSFSWKCQSTYWKWPFVNYWSLSTSLFTYMSLALLIYVCFYHFK